MRARRCTAARLGYATGKLNSRSKVRLEDRVIRSMAGMMNWDTRMFARRSRKVCRGDREGRVGAYIAATLQH